MKMKTIVSGKPNCQYCISGKGDIPIQDSETQLEIWICEVCDKKLFD